MSSSKLGTFEKTVGHLLATRVVLHSCHFEEAVVECGESGEVNSTFPVQWPINKSYCHSPLSTCFYAFWVDSQPILLRGLRDPGSSVTDPWKYRLLLLGQETVMFSWSLSFSLFCMGAVRERIGKTALV